MHFIYILIPVLGAFSGWLIISLCLHFFFHPALPEKIYGITLQGVFPAQQKKLAKQLSEIVNRELVSFSSIEDKATSPEIFEQIKPVIDEHLDDFLRNKLSEKMPVVSMFIGEKTINQLKETFMGELQTLFPVIMKNYVQNLKSDFNIEQMIESKINSISSLQAEILFKNKFRRQILHTKIFAAAVGFVIGLFQFFLTVIA